MRILRVAKHSNGWAIQEWKILFWKTLTTQDVVHSFNPWVDDLPLIYDQYEDAIRCLLYYARLEYVIVGGLG